MASRLSFVLFLTIFLATIFASSSSTVQGRKLLHNITPLRPAPSKHYYTVVPTLEDMQRMYFNVLPKGKVPASTPTKKGHAVSTADEKLIARHLAALDRILGSVPSPGVGH